MKLPGELRSVQCEEIKSSVRFLTIQTSRDTEPPQGSVSGVIIFVFVVPLLCKSSPISLLMVKIIRPSQTSSTTPSSQENPIKHPSPPITSVIQRAAPISLLSLLDIILSICHSPCCWDSVVLVLEASHPRYCRTESTSFSIVFRMWFDENRWRLHEYIHPYISAYISSIPVLFTASTRRTYMYHTTILSIAYIYKIHTIPSISYIHTS